MDKLASQSGTSIIEYMLAVALSGIVSAMVVSTTLMNRQMYRGDVVRTRANQNLKSALNIIGAEIRQAGERFPSSFPAVQIVAGADGSDELILRRNLLNQVIVGCDAKSAGAFYQSIALGNADAVTAVCTHPNQSGSLAEWSQYISSMGEAQPIYIFNQSTKQGEFLEIATDVSQQESGFDWLVISQKQFQFSYPAEFTSIYMIQQWRIRLNDQVLEVIVNENSAQPLNVIDGISEFQVEGVLQDGTVVTSFDSSSDWTTLAGIRLVISGTESVGGNDIQRTVSAQFFPRNILSH